MPVSEHHKVRVQGGKEHVTWEGLLDTAHERFDHFEINTVFHGFFGESAVATATFKGYDHKFSLQIAKVKTSGIGDASPENVGRNIVPHIIRMAETRAKGRALRDALNIGEAMAEEFSDSTPQSTSNRPSKGSTSPAKTRQGSTPTPSTPKTSEGSSDVPAEATNKKEAALQATRQQIAKLNKLMEFRAVQTDQGVEEIREGFVDFIGFDIKDLSRGEAHKYIKTFERKIEEHEAEPGEAEEAS